MKDYYEAHITYEGLGTHEPVEGWTHSAIAGDITYGEGLKQYLTAHFSPRRNTVSWIAAYMEEISAELRKRGFTVLRNKVELVVYDNRFK